MDGGSGLEIILPTSDGGVSYGEALKLLKITTICDKVESTFTRRLYICLKGNRTYSML